MSKVVLLSGSPNAEGNTVQILREAEKVLNEKGLETELISLSGLHLRDSMDPSPVDDGMGPIIAKIKEAQGLIVAGPVYWGSVRGALNVALQRIAMASMRDGNFLSRKIGGPIVVGRRGGLTSSLTEMLMFYLANDMIVPGSTYWNIVFGQAKGEAVKDEEGVETIRRFSENVAYLIKATER
jgi:multimeric flavodoxin WrbA